jgi:hypothetical protein
MIEEVTPWMLTILVLLVTGLTPVLTLLLSALLLWRYRRVVIRQMAVSGGFDEPPEEAHPAPASRDDGAPSNRTDGAALYRLAARGPWQIALRYAGAGLAFALVFAVAARFVYPYTLGPLSYLLAIWVYCWPVVPALLLIVPGSWRVRIAYVGAYFAMFLLIVLWAGTVLDIPGSRFGAIELPARSSSTPSAMLKLWLVINGAPTLLILLCFNRWVRAVAPLVLVLVTMALCGVVVGYLGLLSKFGFEATVAAAVALELHPGWLVLGIVLLFLMAFVGIGWLLTRWIASAYRRGTVSDQSLTLDALWLLFASYYGMWLVLGGLAWAATAVVAFAVFKLALALTRRLAVRAPQVARGLTFLRVFSLGRRSERLLDTVAKYWRHVGSVQMITGPDVAHSTVQPHQFLDFLSRKLAAHFVRDAPSLTRSVTESDRTADPDGRYRINSFFCQADSWQRALPLLVQRDDVVLMDLRSFSATNAGCIHELQHLVGNVPLDRCLLIVDATTDDAFLASTLREAWRNLPQDSPNRNRSPDETPLNRLGSGTTALRDLVQRLCEAGAVPAAIR